MNYEDIAKELVEVLNVASWGGRWGWGDKVDERERVTETGERA